MRQLRALWARVKGLLGGARANAEIGAELESHLQMHIDDNLRAGMTAEEARRRALIQLGGFEQTRQAVRDRSTLPTLEIAAQDIRYSFRQLRKTPGFTVSAVLTLATAIAANAVVFSVLDALVLRPLNLPRANRLYNVEAEGQSLNSYPDFQDLRDRNRTLDGITAYNFAPVGLDTDGNPEQIWIFEGSGEYFDVLGVKPYLGRFFHRFDEHGPDSSPYVVLSYSYWRTRFHGDASVVGRTVQLNRHPFTILGVAPPGFRGTEMFFSPALWAPLVDQAEIEGANNLDNRIWRSLWLMARVKPGVAPARAEADLNAVAGGMQQAHPKEDDGLNFALSRPGLLGNLLGNPVRAFVAGLMLLAGLILLAACANLGSLFAARAADRSRETALRLALGSTRRRIMRQLLTEAVLIGLAGGAAGTVGSVILLRALSAWQPLPHIPVAAPVNPNVSTYIVALALALVSGFLFGLVPVRQVLGAAPWEVLKAGGKATAGGRWFSARDILLIVQITACAVLVTASLVAVRGLMRSLHSNFGFNPENAVLASTDLNMAAYRADRQPAMQKRMLQAVAALPGVSAAGLVDTIPLGVSWSDDDIYANDATEFRQSKHVTTAVSYSISPGYFAAADTTLLAGRDITWHDDDKAPKVAVVNREFAREVFGSVARAVGGYFRLDAKTQVQVVGVVQDGRYKTLTEDQRAALFQPILQLQSSSFWLVVRSQRNPQEIAASLQECLRGLDDGLPFTVLTWQNELDSALFAARVATVALGVLGLLGAMLAVTGIFGMASYSVSRRLRELGIRVALGAGHGQVLGAAVGRAVRLLALGSAAGLLLGMAATRVLSYIVYQATPFDPLVLSGVVSSMLLLGLAATWAPARRALRIDPSRLMRED